ncbi:hypothetical protein, partial [Sphingobacterium bambusae]
IFLKELFSPPRRALAFYISWHHCPNYLVCFPPSRWDCKGRRLFWIRKIKLNFFFDALSGFLTVETPFVKGFFHLLFFAFQSSLPCGVVQR